MRVSYTTDAVQFTARILDGMRAAGWVELVEAAGRNQREMEQRLLSIFGEVREAAQRGDGRTALALLFGDADGGFSPEAEEFIESARREAPNDPSYLARQMLESLQALVPNDVYTPRVPLNVVAALDAAYHATVLPRRCYAAAARRLGRLTELANVRADLTIVDEEGTTVYGPNEQAQSAEQEQAFWRMFNVVLQHFQLAGVVADVETEPRRSVQPAHTFAAENVRAARLLATIAADRQGIT
jgi:hypothetical protein